MSTLITSHFNADCTDQTGLHKLFTTPLNCLFCENLCGIRELILEISDNYWTKVALYRYSLHQNYTPGVGKQLTLPGKGKQLILPGMGKQPYFSSDGQKILLYLGWASNPTLAGMGRKFYFTRGGQATYFTRDGQETLLYHGWAEHFYFTRGGKATQL